MPTTDARFALACGGCGMIDPCGYHFDDCPLLERGDFVVPASYRGSSAGWTREDVGLPRHA